VAPRSILFIGGTGVISATAAQRAVAVGHRLTILNRGRSTRPVPDGVETLHADVRDVSAVQEALAGREFDAVADFITYKPDQAKASIDLFAGRTGQYVFISSASAYQKPPTRLPIRESTPLKNPFWQYSRDKIACEDLLYEAYREQDFPLTVVRPSHTYDRTKIAMVGGWTDIHRMRAGLPVMVHGDGTSLWTLTHSRDFAKAFVGLLGRPQAVGESYTITSDEYLPWNQIYKLLPAQPVCRSRNWYTCPPKPSRPTVPNWGRTCWATAPTRWFSTTPRSSPWCRTTAPPFRLLMGHGKS
jgi:nucleoside-diphosphate-sugar epimerase